MVTTKFLIATVPGQATRSIPETNLSRFLLGVFSIYFLPH